jgi:aspartate 1-decarboxylase
MAAARLDNSMMEKSTPRRRFVLSSKIHKATVTQAELGYIGSITIDEALIERVDLWPGERVLVVSNTSGARLETYVIAGARDSGTICMNGACAHLINVGEELIIMGFSLAEAPIRATAILVDERNRFVRYLDERPHEECSPRPVAATDR